MFKELEKINEKLNEKFAKVTDKVEKVEEKVDAKIDELKDKRDAEAAKAKSWFENFSFANNKFEILLLGVAAVVVISLIFGVLF